METKKIFTINNVDIVVTDENLIPIKPICEALGIDAKVQRQKIQEDEDLCSVGVLSTSTGADGKQYDMYCLPHQFIYGWLFTINPKNVKPEAKESVRKYRKACYDALYHHFNGQQERRNEQDAMEKSLLAERDAVDELEKNLKEQMTIAKKQKVDIERKIERIRQERFTNEPTLFP